MLELFDRRIWWTNNVAILDQILADARQTSIDYKMIVSLINVVLFKTCNYRLLSINTQRESVWFKKSFFKNADQTVEIKYFFLNRIHI